MANLAQIQSIAQGQFFVKDSLGNLVELKVGDTVSLNDTIVAASSNTDLSKIEILFDTNELIILSQGEQLLDATLLASTFGNEELAFDKQEVDETLNAWNNAQDGDATDMETAAGDVTEQATNAGDERAADGGALRSKFNSRDGASTDVRSDLRDASWAGGIERTIEDAENMLLEQPLPIVYTIIEGLEVVNEGDSANYVVKLVDAAGNPVIATQDTIIYVRYTNKTTQDGDTEYNHNNVIEVVIKAGTSQTEFTIKTLDDWKADNGEVYNVGIIGNNSTQYDMRNGDVNGNKTNVDTTILDNTTTNPNEDSNVESDMEKVVLKIVAADENGNPIKDTNGDYLTQNEVPEGDNAYYVVLAFEPNTTKFNDNTKLDIQSGTVEVKTFDKDARGTTTQTKEDGTQDYVSKTQTVELGKVISVETLDDWKADNGEQYEIKITDKSYEHPTTGAVYENVVTDKDPVTTTIKDNTTTNPNNPSTIENNQEKVILKIVAVDKDGNPLFEADGKTYKTTSDVVEGDSAYYKVFAFAPDSKVFNTDTKLPDNLQGGTVTVKTGNIGAIGVPAETLNDGSQDYISNTQTDVKVGETIFTVKTIDDYKAEIEADETFKVEIEVGSYKHPNNDIKDAIYENITVDSTVVTTTIVDNNATKNADVVTGGTDTNSTTYGAEDTVYAIITADKSSVNEGEIVTYTVKLVDYKGNEVKVSNPTDVTIKFTGVTANPADLKDLLKINGIEVTNMTKDTFTIEIPKDKSSIDFTIETKDDVYTEGKESYTLKIEDVDTNEFENIKFNEYTGLDTTKVPNPSNTTTTEISDNGTEVKIVLVAVTSSATTIADITDSNGKLVYNDNNITPESGKLYYVAVAVDKDNNVLIQEGKVKVSTYDVADGAKGGNSVKPPLDGSEDYQSLKGKEVSLGEVFDVQTNDDYVRDNNETFTVKIDSIVDGSKYEKPVIDTTRNTVTSTITDNAPVKNHEVDSTGGIDGTVYGEEDTVWALISADKSSVVEGNEVTYTVKLVDKDGKAVTVSSDTNVTIKFKGADTNGASLDDLLKFFGSNGTTEIMGFDNTNQELTISIPKGSSSTQFTIQTKDDFTQEGNETFDLNISKIDSTEFENLVFDKTKAGADNKVTTEIKDGVTLGTPKNAYVDEDKFYENRLDGTKGENIKKANIDDTKSLGIIKNGETDFKLSFESDNPLNPIPIVTVQKGRPAEGSNPSTLSKFEYQDGSTTLKSDGNEIKYKLVGTDKIVGYTGLESAYNKNKVFEITLEKNNEGKYSGDYKYTQFKNIDHPIDGGDKNINDDDITFEFGFKITDQGSTSDVQKFKVTVNDSTPLAGDNTLIIYEDNDGKTKGAYTFVLSDEGFQKDPKDPSTKGQIEIDNNDGKGYQTVAKDGIVSIYDGNEVVGTLKNNGNGTLTFEPVADYSKYTDDNLPNFKYKVYDTDGDYAEGKVNIKVKPVVDGTDIKVENVTTYEDASKSDDKTTGNKAEGQNSVSLGLKQPTIKDNTDKNGGAKGDHGERVGELTLSFANGQFVAGAKLLDKDGNPLKYNNDKEVVINKGYDDKSAQVIKVVIVDENGKVDYSYHTKDVQLGQNDTIYLTKEAYEGLKINHAEDNDRDIKIKISTKTYEVNDDGEKLSNSQAKDQGKIDSKDMIVVIKPVTDPIEIHWDNTKDENGKEIGTISADKKTFTFTESVKEGEFTLDLNKFLSNTSGTKKEDGHQGKGGDLDGSEKRGYWIKGLPVGTKITITNPETNQKETVTVKEGEYDNGTYLGFTLVSANTQEDPKISFEFPPHFSGEVKATLELQAQDQGYDTGWGIEKETDWGVKLTDEVRFNIFVNPVADEATLKVGQVIGYEDAGRTSNDKNGKYDKNIQDKDGSIKHPENGIALDIKVTSTDKDGSETFTVTIKDIPNGGAIFVKEPITGKDILVTYAQDGTPTIKVWNNAVLEDYTGTVIKADKGSITVEKYDNENPPKFIPPHNEHGDFTLNVEAKTVDRVYDKDGNIVKEDIQTVATSKPITVIVKDVADSVVGNDYNQETLVATPNTKDEVIGTHEKYNAIVNEDTEIKLSSIFNHDGKGGFDSTKLASYDSSSEDLTIIIKEKDLNGGTLEGKDVNYVNGQYIFKATDIDGITIKTPANYSGELKFDITYITTERGDDNGKPSKTFDSKTTTDSVSIFVKPTVDAGFISNTTKLEDGGDIKQDGVEVKDGLSYYKLDLGISHQNGDTDETLESVKLDKPVDGDFKLFIKNSDGSFTAITDFSKTYTAEDIKNIYVQAPENKHGDFTISGSFVAKDSQYAGKNVNYESVENKSFSHTLTITPVTDKPTITVENGTQTHINVESGKEKEIKIPVKVTSDDKDGSENITKIVISGVPSGVSISFGDAEIDTKVTVSEHNGIYTIIPKDGNYKLNDADFKNITFSVSSGANFEHRDITITAYTKDADGSKEEQTSTKITLDKTHNGTGGPGIGPKLDIVFDDTKDFKATEDKEFNFLDVFKVVADSGNDGRTELNFKIDVGSNATIKGLTPNADGSYTITGNRADIESVLASLKVVPNKDFNNNHKDDKGTLDITVTIDGKTPVEVKVPVTPVTDTMNVEITPKGDTTINENGEFKFDVKLTNNSDKEFTNINDFYVVVNEIFEAGETAKGELYLGNTKLELVNGKYKLPADYKLGDTLNLNYKSGEDRNGTVEIKVVVVNKETGATNELTSSGATIITVKPIVSSEIEIQKVQDGIEDGQMASVKLNVTKPDLSEKFESVLIKVAPGVAVYYDNGSKLAMNVGDGSWLVPVNSNGTLPEIFFKGKEDLAGNIDFTATVNVKDGSSKVTATIPGSVYIKEVADGVTIDPTKTGIDKNAFEWTTLNLNANMKDVDGSEKMHFTIENLDSSAQFRVKNSDGTYTDLSSKASQDASGKWTINGVEYKDINNIEISHDKSVSGAKVEAWTVDGDGVSTSNKVEGTFDLSYKADAKFDNGIFTLAKDMDIDFNNIGKLGFTNIEKIDLGAGNGKNELLNLTLQDVLDMGKKDGSGNINLKILGNSDDKLTFADKSQWQKSDTPTFEGGKTFTEWSNTSGDSTVTLKIEQPISDGITN